MQGGAPCVTLVGCVTCRVRRPARRRRSRRRRRPGAHRGWPTRSPSCRRAPVGPRWRPRVATVLAPPASRGWPNRSPSALTPVVPLVVGADASSGRRGRSRLTVRLGGHLSGCHSLQNLQPGVAGIQLQLWLHEPLQLAHELEPLQLVPELELGRLATRPRGSATTRSANRGCCDAGRDLRQGQHARPGAGEPAAGAAAVRRGTRLDRHRVRRPRRQRDHGSPPRP